MKRKRAAMMMIRCFQSLHVLCLLIGLMATSRADAQAAPSFPVELSLEWVKNAPRIHLVLRAREGADIEKLTVPLQVTGANGHRYWGGNVTVNFDEQGIGQGHVNARVPEKLDAPYQVRAAIHNPDLGIDAIDQMLFGTPKDVLKHHNLRMVGRYPDARVGLSLVLNESDQYLEAEVTLRDREKNQILRKAERYEPSKQERSIHFDLTPPPRSVGPFAAEYQIVNEAGTLHIRHEQRFGHANTVIPLTSMQSDRLIDWHRSAFKSPRSFNRGSLVFNSDVLGPPAFDTEESHSGGRSIRLSYQAGVPTHIYSNLELPGYPVRAYLWVKGNNSSDRLVAFFRDRCETARYYWERHVNRSEAVVCTLDFEGWRRFNVPVLGNGLQTNSRHENQKSIATPIYLLAFSVESGKPEEGEPTERVIWIDDLALETQTYPNDMVSLEVRADTPDAQLHANGRLIVSVGNGTPEAVTDGRLQVVARDRNDDVVFDTTRELEADANDFSFVEIPLTDLAELDPEGPVEVEVAFTAPSAALRIRKSLVLKAPKHAAVMWDFEGWEQYNGFNGTGGAKPVPGGAEGTRQALALVTSVDDTGETTPNSAVLHPKLPGFPARIEMMVKGGAVPARLQPFFLDAGRTGVTNMPYNKLPGREILVDWQDWRRVVVPAPAIPAEYNFDDRLLVFQAAYPLNLLLSVNSAGDGPAQVLVDRIKVYTHLDDSDALVASVVYPDEKAVISPDGPLSIRLLSFHDAPRKQTFSVRLKNARGKMIVGEKRTVDLRAGEVTEHVLVDRLPRGIYSLQLEGVGPETLQETVVAIEMTDYFGDSPETLLKNLPALERQLGMATRRIYLDWDNMELVPGLFHYDWFNNDMAKAAAGGKYSVVPILGFSADWSGPEKWASVQEKAYERFIGNHMQVPIRLTDWSRYVREAVREYAGKVAAWEFWENPDYRGSPAYISPERYPEFLKVVRRWVDIYDPETPVIAGGFSVDHIYQYLRAIPDAHTLPFDRLGIQFNVGELSPEEADMEGLFDDLESLLKLRTTGRELDVPQLDWAVSDLVSPVLQGGYHARASLILNRRIQQPYRLKLINDGETFEGFGLFYKRRYGNTQNVQLGRPIYLPKPAYFAFVTTRRALKDARFDSALEIPDRKHAANYVYLYEKAGGVWMAALWRAHGAPREYRVPESWRGASVMDAFGTSAPFGATVRLGPVPLFVTFPAGRSGAQLRHDLRVLEPADDRDQLLLALMTAETESAGRAEYQTTGTTETETRRSRRLIGGEPLQHAFVNGITQEQFSFTSDQAGPCRLNRVWYSEDGVTGSLVTVSVNGGPEQTWDLSLSKAGQRLKQAGTRASSLILPSVAAGANRITVRHNTSGNTARWTVSPLLGNAVDLAYWPPISAVQSKGYPLQSLNARGATLRIGENAYDSGIGTLAPAYIEFPLQQRFSRFQVTVGIDAAAEGQGNVEFTLYGDGRLLAESGTMTGFSEAKALVVEDIGNVSRLVLRVENVEGSSNGLANWVDAKLFLKTQTPPE